MIMSQDIFYFQESEIPAAILGISKDIFTPLRAGIKTGRVVAVRYTGANGDCSRRTILPEVLFRHDDDWYLAAFCYLRNDSRTFRIDRIDEAELLERKDQSHGIAKDIREHGVSWFAQDSPADSNPAAQIKNTGRLWIKLELIQGKNGPEFHVSSSCPDAHHEKTVKDFSFDLIRHSEDGNIDRMKEDIAAGAEINFKAGSGTTALTGAARHGHFEAVKFLVEHGADVHLTDGCGSTALITASRATDMNLVRYLLEEQHSDINHRDRLGWSALYCAVLDNHPEMVRYYLEHGADVNIRDREEETPLMECFCSHFVNSEESMTLAEILVHGGADLDLQDKEGRTALFFAIEKGNHDAADFILDSGASPHIRDKKGNTPLLYALQRYHCQSGSDSLQTRGSSKEERRNLLAMTHKLIALGADVNSANVEGITPLMLAHGELLRFLLKNGANAAAATKVGTSVAMYHPDELDILRLLEVHGADITARNRWDNDVLLLATPRYLSVRYLIEKYGFSTNDKNSRNETILHRACEAGDLRLVKYLMCHGANQNIKNVQGKTPYEYLDFQSYMESASDEDYDIMDYLEECKKQETENLFTACREFDMQAIRHALEYGACIERVKERRTTVMTVAADRFESCEDISADAFREIVSFLHQAGADINAVDLDGTCVLSALIGRHEVELLQEFLACGADPNVRSRSDEFNSLLEDASIEQELFMLDHNGESSPRLEKMLDVLKSYGADHFPMDEKHSSRKTGDLDKGTDGP